MELPKLITKVMELLKLIKKIMELIKLITKVVELIKLITKVMELLKRMMDKKLSAEVCYIGTQFLRLYRRALTGQSSRAHSHRHSTHRLHYVQELL